MNMFLQYSFVILLVVMPIYGNAQIVSDRDSGLSLPACDITLENGILTIENSQISRKYLWNNGNIITQSLTDKLHNKVWQVNSKRPDLTLPGETDKPTNPHFTKKLVAATTISPAHLEGEVVYSLGSLEIKRVFRLYPDCPVIACDLYYRGYSTNVWYKEGRSLADMENLEKLSAATTISNCPVIENIELPGKHWGITAVEFIDITDRFNTLVKTENALAYKPDLYRGNLLFAFDNQSNNGIFILKEAPSANVQLDYPGGDFVVEYGKFSAIGAGLNSTDLDKEEWIRGYGFATGVYSGNEMDALSALRNYQKKLRIMKEGRDEMIMMNTWGDRGQDTRVRESFAFSELEAGARLGITHFQLDDGWQTGRSSNSAFKGGSLESIWTNPHYWEPDPERFPNGLMPLIKKSKEVGIELCLWFNPSRDNSNANWEKDADALISIYRKYGIRTFKIDGVNLPDKLAERNFRKFLDKVSTETEDNVVFNLDVTAGRRGGYHYFNEYGNLFLENRYTDWQNYYPYTTLRNLWMLSKYVPSQRLQIEFLNKWRNQDKYEKDPFGPANYSFEYLFAITMAAQPLAWFEATGLPEEAITKLGPVIKKYREIQCDLHKGDIFPIGDEPSGKSWTGFQSVQNGQGYFIIFREDNDYPEHEFKTWLPKGVRIKCTPVLGKGSQFSARVEEAGMIKFSLRDKNSYTLYKYSIE